MTKPTLASIAELTERFHGDIAELWTDLPEPSSPRSVFVSGSCEIVRQHTVSQFILASNQFDLSAAALVRPTFESLVRAIWCMAGASDAWIEGFAKQALEPLDPGTDPPMGPPVQKMLDEIEAHHPAHVHEALSALKKQTWRTMHAYVHGGIRPMIQGFIDFQEHEAARIILNANGMLLMATNVLRMSLGVTSPQLPALQLRYAKCLPPAKDSH